MANRNQQLLLLLLKLLLLCNLSMVSCVEMENNKSILCHPSAVQGACMQPVTVPGSGADEQKDNSDEANLEINVSKIDLSPNKEKESSAAEDNSQQQSPEASAGGTVEADKTDERTKFSCKDADGKEVQWFIAIKLQPKGSQKGIKYYYISSNNDNDWDSTYNICSEQTENNFSSISNKGPIGRTLSQIDIKEPKDTYFVYNDVPAEGNQPKAHMRGFMLFRNSDDLTGGQGFWLIYSVPNWDSHLKYPKSGKMNAQSIMCVTMNKANFDKSHGAVLSLYPKIRFQKNSPPSLSAPLPPINLATHSSLLEEGQNMYNLRYFSNYDRNHRNGISIYQTVKQDFACTLLVRSFGDGYNRSDDWPENVERIKFHNIHEILAGSDHSKWCVCLEANNPWICIGDINQRTYPNGGLLCLQNKRAKQKFIDIIVGITITVARLREIKAQRT